MVTEDDNLRIRKTDIAELKKTDVVEFMTNLKLFERRTKEKMKQYKKQNG